MTVSTTTRRNDYTGNGTTLTYAYSFKIFANTELELTLQNPVTDAEVPLTLGTHYTVTGVGVLLGGNIVLIAGAFDWIDGSNFFETSWTITIRRVLTKTQLTDIRNQGSFLPEIHEDQFDRTMMSIQELQDDAVTRSLSLPVTFPTTGLSIPEPEAGKYLQWKTDLSGLQNVAAFVGELTSPLTSKGDLLVHTGSVIERLPIGSNGQRVEADSTQTEGMKWVTKRLLPATKGDILSYSTVLANLAVGTDGQLVSANSAATAGLQYLSLPIGFYNLGLDAITTTTTDDSIRITSASGAALSTTNPGYVVMASATLGRTIQFKIVSDVTIDLTGAHWGLGTNGNITDYELSIYALNDSGTVRWGVAAVPNHNLVLDADDNATATSITLVDQVLVDASLTGGDAQALELGWIKAAFNDTGDIWTIQGSDGDINLGARREGWNPFAPDGDWTGGNVAYAGEWQRAGVNMECAVRVTLTGAPTGGGFLQQNIPSGFVIDTANLPGDGTNGVFGFLQIFDSGTGSSGGLIIYNGTTNVQPRYIDSTAAGPSSSMPTINNTNPQTFATGDRIHMNFKVPIVGWT